MPYKRNKTSFVKGGPIPKSPGRPPKTPIEKEAHRLVKKYARQRVNTFIEACENLLPIAVDRVEEALRRKGEEHGPLHLRALETLGDRVYGRPAQAITGAGGGPLVVSFQEILAAVPEGKREKI